MPRTSLPHATSTLSHVCQQSAFRLFAIHPSHFYTNHGRKNDGVFRRLSEICPGTQSSDRSCMFVASINFNIPLSSEVDLEYWQKDRLLVYMTRPLFLPETDDNPTEQIIWVICTVATRVSWSWADEVRVTTRRQPAGYNRHYLIPERVDLLT